ncbi:MFS transporter [Agromyces mediolanus]|uniref:MFS transporter n=1 Tax=Agromyces mediolanus TaxID=41986 RepID=UPI00383811A8
MSNSDLASRVPLRLPSASATFAIAIAGYLGVNLSPYMIGALQSALGTDVLTASWIVTGALLATAIVGLAIAPLCAGPRRRLVARAGLALGVLGFGAAALLPVPGVVVGGLLLGGAGAGGAVAAAGAALAAFRNPDRVAGFNGLANRGIITVVLAVLPVIGLAPLEVFGALALFSLIGLVLSAWLPAAPVHGPQAGAAVAEAMPVEIPPTGAIREVPRRTPATAKAVTIAGFTLLVTFALWAASEDSLWAMAGFMGTEQAGLTPEGLGIALSGATAGGLVGSLVLTIVGDRLGRAAPLGILLVAGGALKIAEGFASDPTTFIVIFVAWNTIYALAFMYFVSTSAALDADGRWSGPLLAVYLVGSSLTPVIGAALVELLGFQGFAVALGIASFVLAVPTVVVARLSTRLQREERLAIPTATTTEEVPA